MLIKKPQPVRHEHLAAELTDASQRHNEEVSASRDRFETVRDSVVNRAAQCRQAIRALQAELDQEEELLAQLIEGAGK